MAETLDDLVEAIQYAVIEAQKVAEDHHIDLVSRFFEEDEDSGQLRATVQEIWVPSVHPDAKENTFVKIDVPLITLASLGAIRIKELKVEFDARLSSLDTAEDEDDDKDDTTAKTPVKKTKAEDKDKKKGPLVGKRGWSGGRRRKRMVMDFKKGAGGGGTGTGTEDKDTTVARISITFQGTEPPEGVVRLNDRILKMIP